jgi:trans-aconitate methyltransferase
MQASRKTPGGGQHDPFWDPKLYNRKHAFVWEQAKEVIKLLAPKPGEKVLDLGCGTGHLTAEIAARGAKVVGIDRSPEMIAEAQRRYPGTEFRVRDARRLSFDAQFDAVFSNAALHWIREPEQVIQGVVKALKPGGRFVVEFGGRGNIERLIGAIGRAGQKFGLKPGPQNMVWYYPSLAQYAALLEAHGLEVQEAKLFDRPTRLEDGEKGLEAWLRMFTTFILDRLPAKRQAEFLREVEKQSLAELFRDGSWELDYRRLRMAAWKGSPFMLLSKPGRRVT